MKLNYNPYAKHFTIESENGSNLNTLTLKWSTGKMEINIADLLPCTAKKFTLLLDTIKISEYENENISFLADFIKQACSFFDEWIKKEYDAKRKAGYIAELKKWKKHYDALRKRYDLEKIDNAEIVKYKSAYIYRMQGKAGSATITRYSGFTFEKYGHTLQVYKTDRKARYEVIVPCFGLYIVSGSSKAAAVAAFTEEIAGKLKKIIKTSDSAKTRNDFISAMIESGFDYVLEDPLYSVPVFHEEEPEKAAETETEKASASDTKKPEKVNAETAAATYPVKEARRHPVRNALKLRYDRIAALLQNIPAAAGKDPGHVTRTAEKPLLYRPMQAVNDRPIQAVADPMKLYRHGITTPEKTGLQGFTSGKTGKLLASYRQVTPLRRGQLQPLYIWHYSGSTCRIWYNDSS